MKHKRLKRLIEVLEQVERESRPFNMHIWVRSTTDEVPLLTTPVEKCGTASCAFGWAARDPILREEGLYLQYGEPVFDDREKGLLNAYEAAEAFFEITDYQAQMLFNPISYYGIGESRIDYITPRMVITRIEEMLKEDNNAV